MPEWTKLWEGRGYPHPFLMMQITNIRYHDNGSPQAALPDFIRRFNDTDPAVRLRFITISDFFDRLRSEPEERLPLLRGDWTDWWNFGSGSTAHETAQALEGQRHLDDALGLDAWHPGEESGRRPVLRDTARRSLALYAEHTWGADRSIRAPLSPETRTQLLLKLAYAPEGASLARMLRRDGLERLAEDAGGEAPRLLVYNPHPFPVRRSLRLPYLPPLAGAPEPQTGLGVETFVPTGPSSHRIQRQDVILADIADDRRLLERADRGSGVVVCLASRRSGPARRWRAAGRRERAVERTPAGCARRRAGRRDVADGRRRRVLCRRGGCRCSLRRARPRAGRGENARRHL